MEDAGPRGRQAWDSIRAQVVDEEDRLFTKLAGAKLSTDRIAAKMGCSPWTLFKAARRLAINLGPQWQNRTAGSEKALELGKRSFPEKDTQIHLEHLWHHVAECRLISDLATDANKRELFGKLADHHAILADQVE